MKCLTNKQLQQLIDGELSSVRAEQYQQHIASCPSCRERYDNQQSLAKSVTGLINKIGCSPEQIPEFRIPERTANPKAKVRWLPLWAEVAAVLIPMIFVFKMATKPQPDFVPTAENIRMYEMCKDVDANTAFQENMIITTVTDENGKVVECSAD